MGELVQQDSTLPERQPASDGASLMSAIARAAADPTVDVEKMERLFAMYQNMADRQATQAFASAMSAAQAEMPKIGKDRYNEQTKSNYATLEAIDREIRPIYTRHGFSLSFDTEDSQVEDVVRVACVVMHRQGHSRTYRYDAPFDGVGIAGKANKTDTHAKGSAVTYGRRYLTLMIFNLSTGMDDDGNGADASAAELDEKASTWIRVADDLQEPTDYTTQKAKLLKDYGGKASNLPAEVRNAFNRAKARVMPQD